MEFLIEGTSVMIKKKPGFNICVIEMKVYEEVENNEVPHGVGPPKCRALLVTA